MKVFLSHSSIDKPFVEKLAKDILALDMEVWLDKWDMQVGDSLFDKIEEGLETSDYLLIVLSKHSVNSPWVRKELNAFLCDEIFSKRVKILPILIEDCNIPIFLREKLYADFRTDYAEGFRMLREAITRPSKEGNIFIETVNILKGKATENLCLDVILSNSGYQQVWMKEFELEAEIKSSGDGYSPFMYKACYQLKMPYYLKYIPLSSEPKRMIGEIYEGEETEYFQECTGYFHYTNASSGYVWKIKMTAPIQCKVQPKDKMALRMILSTPQKELENEYKEGEMIGRIIYGITQNKGEIRLKTDHGDLLRYRMDDCEKIIEFIANH